MSLLQKNFAAYSLLVNGRGLRLLAASLLGFAVSFANGSPQTFWTNGGGHSGLTLAQACGSIASSLAIPGNFGYPCTIVGASPWASDPSRGSCHVTGGPEYCTTQLIIYVAWACIGNENRSTLSCSCPSGTYFDSTADNGGDSYDARGKCVPQCPSGTANENGVCKQQGDDPGNNGGCPDGSCKVGNPINPGAGIKFERIPLYRGNGLYPLVLDLVYNSRSVTSTTPRLKVDFAGGVVGPGTGGFGGAWIADHLRTLVATVTAPGVPPASVTVQRPDGKILTFNRVGSTDEYGSAIPAFTDKLMRLTENNSFVGWRYTNSATDETEFYDPVGSFLYMANRQGLRQIIGYADGQGNFYYAAASSTASQPHPTGYVAPVCTPPSPGWHLAAGGTPPAGRVLCMSDPFGRQLNFRYDGLARIVAVADPAGNLIEFEYNGETAVRWDSSYFLSTLLTGISGADFGVRTLHYNEREHVNNNATCPIPLTIGFPQHLTGITDSLGQRSRTWTYDCRGRATGSQNGGAGIVYDKSTLAHDTPTPGKVTLTEETAVGTVTRVLNFTTLNGIVKATGTSGPCLDCGPSAATDYDANGFVASRIDWNGSLTCYTKDSQGRETRRVEGLTGTTCPGTTTSATRRITTEWDSVWRLPTRVAEPLRITTYTYGPPTASNPGDRGNVLSKTIQATTDATGAQGLPATPTGIARTWTYTYDTFGQVLSVNGPRTDVADVTTYAYYPSTESEIGQRGNIASVTNALGHVTQITAYNAHGQPLTVVDPNGLTTQLTYDSRLRLKSRNVGGEVTVYDYDPVGQLIKATLPDGSFVNYTYDAAHRMTGLSDNLGNRIAYTLDLRGNRTKEEVFDPANALAQTRSRVYDALNRMVQSIGAQNQTASYVYDLQGNLTSATDPLGRVTTNGYDALHRLVTVTQPSPGGSQPAPVTGYAYNGQDQLTQVTDPRSLITTYAINGLGDTTQQVSPDTGTTNRTYDSAGNLISSTDARGKTSTYTYDALNRVASSVYNQATGTELKTVAYQYDQGANGVGRLTAATETTALSVVLQSVAYAYDQKGRLTSETRTLAGSAVPYVTSYTYNQSNGRLTGMTYPSGRTLGYAFDVAGRISQVSTTASASAGGQTQLLASSVTYHPFGGVKSYTLGNNRVVSRTYDRDGRVASYTLGGVSQLLGYDAASRITGILYTSNAANSNSFGYDNLDRLTQAVAPNSTYAYEYDLTGNRTARSAGSASSAFVNDPARNRLSQITGASPRSFTYDSAGNTLSDGANTFAYDSRGRLVQAVSSVGTTSYHVDAQGRRVRKANTNQIIGDTVYHYDTGGNLIAETLPSGATRREYFYLLDVPVGVSVQ